MSKPLELFIEVILFPTFSLSTDKTLPSVASDCKVDLGRGE
jgi:hypothetical protein